MDALGGKLFFPDGAAFQRMERVEQAHRERRARAHAAAAGQVAVVVDFHAALHFQKAQRFARGRMVDLLQPLAAFDFGIDHADAVLEKRRQVAAGQVAIFVDGRRQHRAAVLAIPRRIIRAAAKK